MPTEDVHELGRIEQQIRIDASPAVVFEVVSRPEHLSRWWSDEADFGTAPGEPGQLAWTDDTGARTTAVEITVVENVPGERFAFRWNAGAEHRAVHDASVLVRFTLRPDGDATLLTVTEEALREQGWEAAVLEQYYASHLAGWRRHLADLDTYAASLEPGRRS